MRRRVIASIILGLFLLGGTACGEGSVASPVAQPVPTSTGAEAAVTLLETATVPPLPTSKAPTSLSSQTRLAPDFTFTLSQGQDVLGAATMKLSQLRGKPLVLNFWARLCGACWHEMPELQEFYEEFQGQVVLLGVDIGEFTGFGSYRDSTKLLQSVGVTYPTGFTNDGKVVREYKVVAMPTTVFISGDGEIFKTWTGTLDRDTVTRLAKAMLRREPAR